MMKMVDLREDKEYPVKMVDNKITPTKDIKDEK